MLLLSDYIVFSIWLDVFYFFSHVFVEEPRGELPVGSLCLFS